MCEFQCRTDMHSSILYLCCACSACLCMHVLYIIIYILSSIALSPGHAFRLYIYYSVEGKKEFLPSIPRGSVRENSAWECMRLLQ